jgi:predicted TIM-barrel fold metal-dependent hydrolase
MDELTRALWDGKPLPLNITDAHAHLGRFAPVPLHGCDDGSLIRQLDRVGISRACCSHHAALATEVRWGNDEVLAAMERNPGRIYGYAVCFPVSRDLGLSEIQRCIDAGMIGIKMHSWNGIPYTSDRYRPVWEYADTRGLPVLLHTWEKVESLRSLFESHPNARILLAHAGCRRPDIYADLATRYEHVYLDLTYSLSKYRLLEYFVEKAGVSKILWGSDMPWMACAHQIGKVVFADISFREKRTILVDNPQRILGLPQTGGVK